MSNFHVTDDGEVKKCTDKTGRCPYLKADENRHFSSVEEAYASIAQKFDLVPKSSSEQRTPHEMKLTPAAQKLVDTLHKDGMTPMIVGGSVRDSLLGKESKDVDIEVFGADSADQVAKSLRKLNKVDQTGKSFGVLKIKIGKEDFDVSLPRRDSKTGDGHRGFEIEVDPNLTFAEAAQRRDFTINSLMYDPKSGEIVDSVGGVRDIGKKTLLHTSDAFDEDPLRVLRGVQMAGRFGFTIHPDTIERSKSLKDEFPTIAKERVQEEFNKLFQKAGKPSESLKALRQTEWDEKIGVLRDCHGDDVYDSIDRAAKVDDRSERPALMSGVIARKILERGHGQNAVRETLSYLTIGDKIKNKALAYGELEEPEGSNYSYRKWAHSSKSVKPKEWLVFQETLGNDSSTHRKRFEELGLLDGPEPDALNGKDLLERFPDRRPGPWVAEMLNQAREEQYRRD